MAHSTSHDRFAGRFPAGSQQAVTVSKNGVRHIRRLPSGEEKEFLAVGLACSECFSGANLYRLLKPGFDYEMKVMESLMNGEAAAPLSIHTSSGVPEALEPFTEALARHLPWKNASELDWCVSLQLEGASAVWAGIDMLLQTSMLESGNKDRVKVAVGSTSYHGPPSTSFGGKSTIWRKQHQVNYPTPPAGADFDEGDLLSQFRAFLEDQGDEIAVILIEPQWGSSQTGMPWPKSLVKAYITLAKEYDIKVLCDEIMCGLGRHGHGTLFVSEAWELDPDAITFGKAIGGGVFPLSGAILKQGRDLLRANKASVMQSHTYAGSSTRALMTATAVLNELPTWLPSIAKLGEEMEHIFRYITKIADGMVICHGQGLMWGGLFTRTGQNKDDKFRRRVISAFKQSCEEEGVIPYFVPVGGFMVSPVIDIDVGTIYEIGERLEKAIRKTMKIVGWVKSLEGLTTAESSAIMQFAKGISDKGCHPILHKTRACTSCSSFVCTTVRTKFVNV